MKPYLTPILVLGRAVGNLDALAWRLVGWTWKRLAAAHTRHQMRARRNLGGIVLAPRSADPSDRVFITAARLAGRT